MTKTFAIAAAIAVGATFAGIAGAQATPCHYNTYTPSYSHVQTYVAPTYIPVTHYNTNYNYGY